MSAEEDDLFGSDDEEVTTTAAASSSNPLEVTPAPSTATNDNSLFGSDSDEEPEETTATTTTTSTTSSTSAPPTKPTPVAKIVNVALRPVTSFSTANRIVDVVNPGTMFINPHRFDKNKYNRREEAHAFKSASGDSAPSRPEAIRWRHKPGTTVPESNARVVVWSDGTMSVVIGNNPMNVISEVPTAPDQSFVYVKQMYDDGDGLDTCLECVGPVGRTLAVRSEANAETAAVKVLGLEKGGGGYTSRRNMGSKISTTDPLKDKAKREQDKDEALRANMRQREGAASMHRGSRAGLKREQNKNWLEGSDDEDEYANMKSKNFDEEDSDDSEEEEMEMTLAEQKSQRQSRRTRNSAVAAAAAASASATVADEEEEDDDEDFIAPTTKKRKLEDDEDEEEEGDVPSASSSKRSRKNAFEDDEEDED